MYLTIQQKEALFHQYDRLIHSIVWKVKRKSSGNFNNASDMYQEAVLAYMEYLDKCKTEEELRLFPGKFIYNRMHRYILASQVVKFPLRTSDFNKKISSIAGQVPYDSLSGMESAVTPVEKRLSNILCRDFLHTLNEREKKIISLKLQGRNCAEIAREIGESCANVRYIVGRIGKKYGSYVAA